MTDSPELLAITNQFQNDVATIVSEQFQLHSYETDELRADIVRPNFFWFWFTGEQSGSFKLYFDGTHYYVVDQDDKNKHQALVDAGNAVIDTRMEQYCQDYSKQTGIEMRLS